MQLDMHYYATYAMARAAGIEPDDARIIATSAQFVDDNVARSHVTFRDGSRIDQEATAHHPINLSNRDERDQRRVWVPFHFIPGNQGDSYTERLKCRMDSPIVRELRDHHLTYRGSRVRAAPAWDHGSRVCGYLLSLWILGSQLAGEQGRQFQLSLPRRGRRSGRDDRAIVAADAELRDREG